MAWTGRFLVIGFASGEIPRPPLNLALLKGCDIRGVYWGEFVHREPEVHRDNMSQLLAWAESGRLNVHIHAKFALEDYPEGVRCDRQAPALGKTLLQFAPA